MLQLIKFKPGINREGTTLTNEGGWYRCNNVRFRSSMPEKIGGWQADSGFTSGGLSPAVGQYWGVARALWNWLNLSGYNLLAIGTNLKYYIQVTAGGVIHDITPIRATTAAGDVTFAATPGSSILTVTDNGHATVPGDFVTYSGAVGLGGAITASVLNAEHRIVEYLTANTYTIDTGVTANGSDTGNGGAAVVGRYQINVGSETYTVGVGWGAGGWGGRNNGFPSTGWGEASPSAFGLGIQLRTWTQGNYGEDLIINPRGGALYYWKNNANPNIVDRAVLLNSASPVPFNADSSCPSVCNGVLVTDNSRFVIAYGVNDYGSSDQDPMLVRWSAQEDYLTWFPQITNQAGSYRFTRGSQIVSAQQTRQEVLFWTDTAVYVGQYQGPPTVWGFQQVADNISIAGPRAAATAADVTYWMGVDAFYRYDGRVQQLRCDLRKFIFENINTSQLFQVCAGHNAAFSEIWWFYCSTNSSSIDSYAVYNYLEDVWYYGSMARTAWIDAGLRGFPIATDYTGRIFYHERGTDDGSTDPATPINAFIESSDFDIGEGHNFAFVSRIIPDILFDGSSAQAPVVWFGVRPRRNPGAAYGTIDMPSVTSANNYTGQSFYEIQRFTQQVNVRVRGRQMAIRVESNALGTAWQLGVPRIDIRPDGRR